MKKTALWICTGVLAVTAVVYAAFLDDPGVKRSPDKLPQQAETYETGPVEAVFSSKPITYGSYGQDVYELQSRLKLLGFFYGKVDSQFGSKTLGSVKWFQSKFGITPDGIVGAKTKLKLVNATAHWKPTETPLHNGGSNQQTANKGRSGEKAASTGGAVSLSPGRAAGLSENELKMMANAVYGEARGEPFEGQVAVAAVILNRVKSPNFPNTPSGVIFQPGAFTAVADGQIWLTPNPQARKAVQQALNGWDPTGGCLYYFNPRTATSKWIWSRPQVKTIGEHIFCM
ncbi:spore cortex-lytic enzyme [Paenibacillus sp. P96]|uniref:Spore cortex-lytic enzyme n=1 Tax=Paenibacillus zeirhizosphaerae TaxID=2987519 RepID=A0ABT9FS16_9BACL|nr:spore cortex-lytic enzyme [Paenibacillus sp. P96]MDP4097480.1 spore cortex-lytic enzyme [Paenibacillus sp. P96]